MTCIWAGCCVMHMHSVMWLGRQEEGAPQGSVQEVHVMNKMNSIGSTTCEGTSLLAPRRVSCG
jgi:hypothetical protein